MYIFFIDHYEHQFIQFMVERSIISNNFKPGIYVIYNILYMHLNLVESTIVSTILLIVI